MTKGYARYVHNLGLVMKQNKVGPICYEFEINITKCFAVSLLTLCFGSTNSFYLSFFTFFINKQILGVIFKNSIGSNWGSWPALGELRLTTFRLRCCGVDHVAAADKYSQSVLPLGKSNLDWLHWILLDVVNKSFWSSFINRNLIYSHCFIQFCIRDPNTNRWMKQMLS